MRFRHWAWMMLATTWACGGPVHLHAQGTAEETKSQIIRNLPVPGDLRDFLSSFGKPPEVENLAERMKKFGVTPEMLKNIQNQAGKPGFEKFLEGARDLASKDPRVSPEFREAIKGFTTEQLKAQFSEDRLRDLQRKLSSANQPSNATPAAAPTNRDLRLTPKVPTFGGVGDPGNQKASSPSMPPPPAVPPSSAPRSDTAIGRGIMNWAKSMEKIDPSLSRSPTLQNVIRELTSRIGPDDPRWQKLGQNAAALRDRLSSFGQSLHLERLAPRNGFSLPRFKAPSFPARATIERGTAPAAPPGGVGFSGPETKGWQGLFTGLVLGGLAIIAWSLLFKRQKDQETEDGPESLGGWPVQPGAVCTRQDLIRAFEYLSLRALGAAARSWNHEIIGARLGDDTTAAGNVTAAMTLDPQSRRHAADELTILYEQARYTPAAEPLPDEALALARRDLCFLAGTTAT